MFYWAKMHRYKLLIEYDGTAFAGWQAQLNDISVQTTIEDALFKTTQQKLRLHAAGRTDAGVHALGQVAHCDLNKDWDPYRLMMALNFYLRPYPVVILKVEKVNSDFHARFSAQARHYKYRILNRSAPPASLKNKVWHVSTKLNIEKMQQAANFLIGFHDFSTFRAQNCQAKSPLKHMTQIHIEAFGEEIHFNLEAPSFLYHQVRNIVGSLSLVGTNKWDLADFNNAFQAKSRKEGGPTAPPFGLYFLKVSY
jgi:tRNA pseudouridine38-40 synthase